MNRYAPPARGNGFFPLSLNDLIITFWASASFYLMYFTRSGNEYVLIIPLVVGAIGLVLANARRPVVARVDWLLNFGVYLLLFSILASYFFNANRFDVLWTFGNIGSAILLFVALYTITHKVELDLRKILVLQCLFGLPLFPMILATAHLQFGRMMPDQMTPNFAGMMALVAFLGACSVRHWYWAVLLALLPLYVIGAMQSRDAMLCVGIAGLVMLGCYLNHAGRPQVRRYGLPAVIGTSLVLIGLYLAGIDLIGLGVNWLEDLFMVNDQYRGIDSGGSGRADLWKAALNIWLTHPIFGVGFKAHTSYMPEGALAHNAYLGMLADLGLVGFTAYMLILLAGFLALFRRGAQNLPAYPQRLAIYVSYIIYGMLESRALSFGNTYSLLMLLVIFDSSKQRSVPLPQPGVPLHPSPPGRQDAAPVAGLVSRLKA